jgi:ABC-type amino acid transport substrate-binding protein
MRRRAIVTALFVAVSLVAVATGCKASPVTPRKPQVVPPAVKSAGVLRAGVDLAYPPFGGIDKEQRAGLDVDVASAIAERLGLTVEFVDVKPSEAASALAEGEVDAVFSVPLTGVGSGAEFAGAYISDAPALFSRAGTGSVEASLSAESVIGASVGVQRNSEAFWILEDQLGEGETVPFDSLREAIDELNDGKVDFVAGDALVGAYIARDTPGIRFVGQVAPATPLGVAVAPVNTTLAEAIRSALDGLAADGVLDTVRAKWVGDLPRLKLSEENTGAAGAPAQ